MKQLYNIQSIKRNGESQGIPVHIKFAIQEPCLILHRKTIKGAKSYNSKEVGQQGPKFTPVLPKTSI